MGIFDIFRGGKKPVSKSGRDVVENLKRYHPGDVSGMASIHVSTHLGRFINDATAAIKAREAGKFPLRFLGVVIPEADADDFDGAMLPAMDKVLEKWAKALKKVHGEAGASFISELAEERGHPFRAGPIRTLGKRTLPNDAAIAAAQAAEDKRRAEAAAVERKRAAIKIVEEYTPDGDFEPLLLEKEDGVVVGATIRTDWDAQGDPDEILEVLLESEARTTLRRLAFGLWGPEENHYDTAVATLAAGDPVESLVDLNIGDYTQEETEVSWTTVGDISPVYAAAPNLKTLRVYGCGIELGALEHDELETLRIHTGGLGKSAIASICEMKCPKLSHLEWWFGAPDYGAEGNVESVAPFLARKDLKALRYLGLQNAEFSNELAKAIVSSPLAAQLTTLDLSLGTLTDEGAQALLDGRDAFESIQVLNVSDNFLSEEVLKELRDAFPEVVSEHQEKYDMFEDDYFYVSVSE